MRIPTPKQILAARANGARSRGPKTPEGKKRSSINALRHGFLARQTVLSNETLENFEALLHQHIARFNPTDDIEHNAVEEMAGANWRHRRLWAMETRLLEIEMARRSEPDPLTRLAESWRDLAATPAFQLFDRYQSRLHCTYQRALQNLFVIRLDRSRSAPGFGPPQNQTNPATSKHHSLLQLSSGFAAETPQNEPGRPGKAA